MGIPKHDADGVRAARELFEATFPGVEATAAAAAPGRINLIGEHTDYSEGYVFPMALTKSTYVVGGKLNESGGTSRIISKTVAFTSGVVELPEVAYKKEDERRWANAAVGMCALYRAAGHAVAPFAAALYSTVPLGSGVSSSASLEVAVGRFLEALNGYVLEDAERARLARKCEHEYLGVNCGIMDQMISSGGRAGHALFIECSTPPRVELVPLHLDGGASVVVANSMQQHQLDGTGGGENWYNDRVASCQAACEVLGVSALRYASLEQLEAVRDKLPDHTAYQRAKHVISENDRCVRAKQAFAKGDLEEFGRLMYQSHASLRDDYAVSSTGLDTLVEIARSVPGVYGCRMSGAGFGGCTVTLAKKDAVQAVMNAMRNKYQSQMKISAACTLPPPDVFETDAGEGARELPLV